jgi:Cdc6-like AAA superfamily ATPase
VCNHRLDVGKGQSLAEVIEYIRTSGKRVVIAMDEFQQILEYPEKGVEALLRSHSQLLRQHQDVG